MRHQNFPSLYNRLAMPIAEAAAALGISRATFYRRLIAPGKVRPIYVAGRPLITLKSLRDLVEGQ